MCDFLFNYDSSPDIKRQRFACQSFCKFLFCRKKAIIIDFLPNEVRSNNFSNSLAKNRYFWSRLKLQQRLFRRDDIKFQCLEARARARSESLRLSWVSTAPRIKGRENQKGDIENGDRGAFLDGGESFFRFTNWFNFFSKSGWTPREPVVSTPRAETPGREKEREVRGGGGWKGGRGWDTVFSSRVPGPYRAFRFKFD